MPLTQPEFERLSAMLEQLEPHVGQMTGASPGFVKEQCEKIERYKQSLFISAKQTSWIENLFEKHVGPLSSITTTEDTTRRDLLGDDEDPEERRDRDDQKRSLADDIDDSIPF